MKKLIGLLLITMLVLSVTGCNVGLSNKHGFGELIIKGSNLTRYGDPDAEENEAEEYEIAAEDLEEAIVKIGSDEKRLGETFVLKTGTYDANIKAGKFAETIKVKVVDINKTTILEPKVVLKKLDFNAWKFTVKPADFDGATVTSEVHLVGDLPDATWAPADKSYPLIKQNGTWSAIFNIPEGTEFKLIYDNDDPDSWDNQFEDKKRDGGNFIVGASDNDPDYVTTPVKAWQFTFNPVGVTGLADALGEKPIETVSLAGGFSDVEWDPDSKLYSLVKRAGETGEIWVGYFEAEEGIQFKFVVNGSIWVGSAGVGGLDDNYAIGQNPDVVTQDF